MISNAFKWGAENGLVYTCPISKGEFVKLDVESLVRKTDQRGSRMTHEAQASVQDCRIACASFTACLQLQGFH